MEDRKGYVCPDWAKNDWDPNECMLVRTNKGRHALVCNKMQTTIYIGDTPEECKRWLKGYL